MSNDMGNRTVNLLVDSKQCSCLHKLFSIWKKDIGKTKLNIPFLSHVDKIASHFRYELHVAWP